MTGGPELPDACLDFLLLISTFEGIVCLYLIFPPITPMKSCRLPFQEWSRARQQSGKYATILVCDCGNKYDGLSSAFPLHPHGEVEAGIGVR